MNPFEDLIRQVQSTFEMADIPRMQVGDVQVLERKPRNRSHAQSIACRKARNHKIVIKTKRVDAGVQIERIA